MSAAAHGFSWLNKQGVRSSAGFEVQSVDRFTIEYREGGKIVTVRLENGVSAGRPVVIVGSDAFSKWDPPFSALQITAEKRQEMIKNFTAAMEFQGVGVSVE